MSVKKTQRRDASKPEEEPALPQEEIAQFFREISDRAWTDAEKELDTIRQKSGPGDWSRGYVKALEGILLSFKSGDDKYIFVPRFLQNSSPESLEGLKAEFAEFSRNEIHGSYDRGFFSALERYLTFTPSTVPQPAPEKPPSANVSPEVKPDLDEE